MNAEDNNIKQFLLDQFAGLNTAVAKCVAKSDATHLGLLDLRLATDRKLGDVGSQIADLRTEVMELGAKYKARLGLWTGISIAMVGLGAATFKFLLG